MPAHVFSRLLFARISRVMSPSLFPYQGHRSLGDLSDGSVLELNVGPPTSNEAISLGPSGGMGIMDLFPSSHPHISTHILLPTLPSLKGWQGTLAMVGWMLHLLHAGSGGIGGFEGLYQ